VVTTTLRRLKRRLGRLLRRRRLRIATLYSRIASIDAPRGLPRIIADDLGHAIRRVCLISSHDGGASLQALLGSLGPHDLVVQFNSCTHNAAIAPLPCRKLLVFRGHSVTGTNHGYRPDAPAFRAAASPAQREIALLFIDNLPSPARAPQCLRAVARDPAAWAYVRSCDPPLDGYPAPDCDDAGPSTGFVVLQLLLEARWHLAQQGGGGFDIVLWGFQHAPGVYFFEGHNWDYERQFIQARRQQLTLLQGGDPVPVEVALP
jgi:hypothetical protein